MGSMEMKVARGLLQVRPSDFYGAEGLLPRSERSPTTLREGHPVLDPQISRLMRNNSVVLKRRDS